MSVNIVNLELSAVLQCWYFTADEAGDLSARSIPGKHKVARRIVRSPGKVTTPMIEALLRLRGLFNCRGGCISLDPDDDGRLNSLEFECETTNPYRGVGFRMEHFGGDF